MQRYYKAAVDSAGNVQPFAQISVFLAGGSETLAPIFGADSAAVPKQNPFNVAADGIVDFYAADGDYHVVARDENQTLIGEDPKVQLFDRESALQRGLNLADLPDKALARQNLGVSTPDDLNNATAAAQGYAQAAATSATESEGHAAAASQSAAASAVSAGGSAQSAAASTVSADMAESFANAAAADRFAADAAKAQAAVSAATAEWYAVAALTYRGEAQQAAAQSQSAALDAQASAGAASTSAASALNSVALTSADRSAVGADRAATEANAANAAASAALASASESSASTSQQNAELAAAQAHDDRLAADADAQATAEDRTATAADRQQTALDRAAVSQMRDQADSFADAAQASALSAAGSASAALESSESAAASASVATGAADSAEADALSASAAAESADARATAAGQHAEAALTARSEAQAAAADAAESAAAAAGDHVESAQIDPAGDLTITYASGAVENAGRARGISAHLVAEVPPPALGLDDDTAFRTGGPNNLDVYRKIDGAWVHQGYLTAPADAGAALLRVRQATQSIPPNAWTAIATDATLGQHGDAFAARADGGIDVAAAVTAAFLGGNVRMNTTGSLLNMGDRRAARVRVRRGGTDYIVAQDQEGADADNDSHVSLSGTFPLAAGDLVYLEAWHNATVNVTVPAAGDAPGLNGLSVLAFSGPKGDKGNAGDPGDPGVPGPPGPGVLNVDGGHPDTNYGGIPPLDCGGPI